MKLTKNFRLSEFNVSGVEIPKSVVNRIKNFHAVPMQKIREIYGKPITVSERSGYRPKWWEVMRGRSGNSQHTYYGTSKGATDWTVDDFEENKDAFLELILEHTQYTRIALYGTFIHCDYKSVEPLKRVLYKNTPQGWQRVKEYA